MGQYGTVVTEFFAVFTSGLTTAAKNIAMTLVQIVMAFFTVQDEQGNSNMSIFGVLIALFAAVSLLLWLVEKVYRFVRGFARVSA